MNSYMRLMVNGTGAWSTLREGEDINTASRSQNAAYLATGDNRGNVCLYRYPCTAERVQDTCFSMHYAEHQGTALVIVGNTAIEIDNLYIDRQPPGRRHSAGKTWKQLSCRQAAMCVVVWSRTSWTCVGQ